MSFNHIDEFFQTIPIVGIVDEDLGSIFLSEDFHTTRNAGCSDAFWCPQDLLRDGDKQVQQQLHFLVEVANELNIIISSEFTP